MTAPSMPSYILEMSNPKIPTLLGLDALHQLFTEMFEEHAIVVTGPANDFPPEFGYTCLFTDELGIPTTLTICIFTANFPDTGHLIEIWRLSGSRYTFKNALNKIGKKFGIDFPVVRCPPF